MTEPYEIYVSPLHILLITSHANVYEIYMAPLRTLLATSHANVYVSHTPFIVLVS